MSELHLKKTVGEPDDQVLMFDSFKLPSAGSEAEADAVGKE